MAHESLRGLKVLAACDSPSSTITDIRLATPLSTLAKRHQWAFKLMAFDHTAFCDIAWADVIVIQRGSNYVAEQLVAHSHRLGKPVIYDIDDLLTEMPTFLRHHGYTKNRAHIESLIRASHLLTVTNARLGEALRPLNQNHAICPNYFEPSATAINPTQTSIEVSPVQLIIAAGDKLRIDMVATALHQLHHRYGDRIRIHGIGAITESLAAAQVPFIKHDAVTYDHFIEFVGGFPNAVGVLPLDDSKFSSCKSPIKYFDYSRAGLPCVCSNVMPYQGEVRHGENGFLCENTPDAWTQALSEAIEAPELRQAVALAAQQEVAKNHQLGRSLSAWESAISSVLSTERRTPEWPLKSAPSWHERMILYIRKLNRQRKVKRSTRRTLP
jgi:glycosyltransferase involved in cell wall biosynthesis